MRDDLADVRALLARAAEAFAARNFDAAADLYAPDAVLFMPGQPQLHGQAAIRAAMERAFGDPAITVNVTVRHIEIADSGELAFAHGNGLLRANGILQRSKWVAVFRRVRSAWRIVADIHNDDGPATAELRAANSG